MSKPDGGAAFPERMESADGDIVPVSGMTLRDYFAAKALQGLLAAPSDAASQDLGPNARSNPEMAARDAYAFADAMIAESTREM